MPDQSYQRTIVYPLEKPIADDLNQDSSQGDRSIRDTLSALLNAQSGVVGGSLQVVQQSPPALGVIIKAGLAFQNAPTDTPSNIGGVIGLNDLSPYKPIVLAAHYDTMISPHNFMSPLGTLINAHLCAAMPNFEIFEIDMDDVPWKWDLIDQPIEIVDGELVVPSRPGLGANIVEEVVAAHPLS